MRRPAIIAWVGLAFGIMASSGHLEIWFAVLIAAGFAWIASERGPHLAIALSLLTLSFGYFHMLSYQNFPRVDTPLRVGAIGYVDRYSALGDTKMIFHATEYMALDSSGTEQEEEGLSSTFSAVFKPEGRMKVGQFYRLTMTIQSAALPRNPGMFNYRRFLDSRGIDFQAVVEGAETIGHRTHRGIEFRERMRQSILEVLLGRLGPEEGQLAAAMILGDTADLDPELLEIYRQTGTAHILAVSGLHFGILFTGAEMLLDRMRLPYVMKKISLTLLVLSFLGLVGLRSSALRAAGMLILAGGLQSSGHQYDRLSGLALAGMGILVFRPVMLFDAGYQMSMAAVYGIAAVQPVLIKPGQKRQGLSRLTDTLALSFAVLVGTALPAAWHFNSFTPISIFINLPVVFLTGLALPLAFLTLPLTWIPVLPTLTGRLSSFGLKMIESAVRFAEGLVGESSYVTATPGIIEGAGVAGILLFFVLRKSRQEIYAVGRVRLLVSALLMTVILFGLPLEEWLRSADRVRFFDVGQGDAALLQTRAGETILIDAGDGRAFREMDQLLLKSGISRLSLMVLTHPHRDHIGGAEAVLNRLKVGGLVLSGGVESEAYGDLKDTAERRGVKVFFVQSDDWIELEKGRLEILNPPGEGTGMEANEASIVLAYDAGGLSFLFTGDITARQEYAIMDRIPVRRTVLKVAHHGSKTSSSEAFISALRPELAVISVGQNSFGHPGGVTLETLRENDVTTFRTDLSGCIEVKVKGTDVYLRRMLKE